MKKSEDAFNEKVRNFFKNVELSIAKADITKKELEEYENYLDAKKIVDEWVSVDSQVGRGFEYHTYNGRQFKFYMRRKNRVYFKRDCDGQKVLFTLSDSDLKKLLDRFKVGQNIYLEVGMGNDNPIDINKIVFAKDFR